MAYQRPKQDPAYPLTSREVLGIFHPDHRWHNIADVDTGNLVTIQCTCGEFLQITLRQRLDSGYNLGTIYRALQRAPQVKRT